MKDLSKLLNNPKKGFEIKQHPTKMTWEVDGKVVISVPVIDRVVEEPENTITASFEYIVSTIIQRYAETQRTSPETSGE